MPAWIEHVTPEAVPLPLTPGGRARRFGSWVAALEELLRGVSFERTRPESFEGRRFVRRADDSPGARARDFAMQYPDEARAMLEGLALHDVALYAPLLVAFDEEHAPRTVDPWGTPIPGREPDAEPDAQREPDREPDRPVYLTGAALAAIEGVTPAAISNRVRRGSMEPDAYAVTAQGHTPLFLASKWKGSE